MVEFRSSLFELFRKTVENRDKNKNDKLKDKKDSHDESCTHRDKRCSDDLIESFENEGLIRNFGELSTDLFLYSPIERCFEIKKKKFWQKCNPLSFFKNPSMSELPKN